MRRDREQQGGVPPGGSFTMKVLRAGKVIELTGKAQ